MKAKIAISVLALLAGGTAEAASEATYRCDDGGYEFTLRNVSKNKVRFTNGAGSTATLKRRRSASGERFSGGGYDVQVKGGEGSISIAHGSEFTDCKLVQAEPKPAAKATDYRCPSDGYAFTLTFVSDDKVKYVDGAGNAATLTRKPSGSGEWFAGGGYDVRVKGREGMVTVDGKYDHTGCTATN